MHVKVVRMSSERAVFNCSQPSTQSSLRKGGKKSLNHLCVYWQADQIAGHPMPAPEGAEEPTAFAYTSRQNELQTSCVRLLIAFLSVLMRKPLSPHC